MNLEMVIRAVSRKDGCMRFGIMAANAAADLLVNIAIAHVYVS